MAKVNNIQVLFDSIRFPQVDRYMLGRGFKILNPADQDSRIYQIDHDQEEHQIRLPMSVSPAAFRSKLQNLVFSLAVIFGQEPIEICNEIFEVSMDSAETESNADSSTKIGNAETPFPGQGFFLTHSGEGGLEVILKTSWDAPVVIGSSEKLLLMSEPGVTEFPEIEHAAGRITILNSNSDQFRLFQELEVQRETTLSEMLPQWFESLAQEGTFASLLEPAVKRLEFELGGLQSGKEVEDFVMKSAATFLTALGQLLTDQAGAAELIWKAACWILLRAHLRLAVSPNAKLDLYAAVSGDDNAAPVATLSWLNDHSRQISV